MPSDRTHAQYSHHARPAILDLACPGCGRRVQARKPSEDGEAGLIGDLSPSWNLEDWRYACSSCGANARGIAFEALPPLFFREGPHPGLWAWNLKHLQMLEKVLAGDSVEEHPYAWLAPRVLKEWVRKGNRERYTRLISRWMEEA